MHGERYVYNTTIKQCGMYFMAKKYDMFGNVSGGVARSNPIIYRNGHNAYQCISYIPKCCDKTSLCIRCVMFWLGLVAGLLGGFYEVLGIFISSITQKTPLNCLAVTVHSLCRKKSSQQYMRLGPSTPIVSI